MSGTEMMWNPFLRPAIPRAACSSKNSKANRRHGVAFDTKTLGDAGLRHIIRIQGIVRARMAAKAMKKKVHMHVIRTKVANELLSTEKSYLKDMTVVVDEFYMPLSSELSKEQLDTLFSNMKDIISVNAKFMAVLEESMKNWGYSACPAEAIKTTINDFRCYEVYINNFTKANQFLTQQMDDKTAAAKIIKKKTSECKGCRGLKLSDFLIMPIQRLPRIILLLKELLKYTPADHPDLEHCRNAHEQFSRITDGLNQSKKIADSKDKFQTISKSVSGLNLQETTDRMFMFEGSLDEIVVNKGKPNAIRTSSQNDLERMGYYVFMFSDVLLCAKRLSAPARVVRNLGKDSTFQFSTPSIIDLYPSTKARIDTTADHAFAIEYKNPDNNDQLEVRIFAADTDKARDDWITHLNNRGPNP